MIEANNNFSNKPTAENKSTEQSAVEQSSEQKPTEQSTAKQQEAKQQATGNEATQNQDSKQEATQEQAQSAIIDEPETSEKNAWVYSLLLWFVGELGIHRFYLQKTSTAIVYLLTGGILGIGTAIDLFVFVFSQVRDNEGRVLSGATALKILVVVMFSAKAILAIVMLSLLW